MENLINSLPRFISENGKRYRLNITPSDEKSWFVSYESVSDGTIRYIKESETLISALSEMSEQISERVS